MSQLLLPMTPARAPTMAEQFEAFHRANPHVLKLIVNIALELRRRGHRHAGMKLIFERIRWLYFVETRGGDFKLNNNYTAFYARKAMALHPRELGGFFRLRKQRGVA